MHKFICIVTLILFFTPTSIQAEKYYINANNIKITQGEYNNLQQLGFTKDEINSMNLQEFINNKNIKGTLISEKNQYYKTTQKTKNGKTKSIIELITKIQYQDEITNDNYIKSGYDGIVETEYKHMHISIIKIDEHQYRYKLTMNWLKIPKVRSYDIIAIGIQPAYVKINSSIYVKQNYTYKDNTTEESITCTPIESKNGGSAIIKLPTGKIKKLSSYLYFNVKKANDNNVVTHMEAGGDYAHATKKTNIKKALKHTVNHSKGIELESKIQKYYDGINISTASWYGIW